MLLKIGNLGTLQLPTAMLFVVERLAFARHQFILAARAGVGQKSVNAPADGKHFRVGDNRLAKLLRFPRNRVFFNISCHGNQVYHNCCKMPG